MTILWDTLLASGIARELDRALEGQHTRALFLDRGARAAALFLRESTLTLRLHPQEGPIVLGPPREPWDQARRLRGRVLGVRSDPDERVLVLELQRARGGQERLNLTVELMSNQWNALLVDVASRRILAALRPRQAGDRRLEAGAEYAFPAPSRREGRTEPISRERWMELLGEVPPGRRRRALLRSVAYTSSLNAPALLGQAAEEESAEALKDLEEGHASWLRLRSLEDARPVLLATPRGPQPYPHPLHHLDHEPRETLLEAMHDALAGTEGATATLVPSGLLDRLRRAAHRARGAVDRLEQELATAPDPAELRSRGDLLLARFDRVPRGRETVVLESFEGNRVELELDPGLSPQDNAARYYEEAARAERARKKLPGLIGRARVKAEKLERALEAAGEGELEPEEIRALAPAPETRGEKGEARLPYRRYRSSGGLEIRVGRGARSNDDLTFHHSDPDDVWLHARHAAGAHVILRWREEGSPPSRDLGEAAILAALHSKARGSGSVPVDWTRRKYVRSPRKSPPGVVIPERVQTVFVEPDPRLEARLRVED